MDENLKMSAIIVNYNSADYLPGCLEAIHRLCDGFEHQIIIIDNDSTADDKEKLNELKDVELVFNDKNLGFAKACNIGARTASRKDAKMDEEEGWRITQRRKERKEESACEELLLFVNPDIKHRKGNITSILEILYSDDSIGAAGAMLVDPDGSLQPSRGSFPTILRVIPFLFDLKGLVPKGNTRLARLIRSSLAAIFAQYKPIAGKAEVVDYLTGAFLLVRRDAFDRVGGFDEDFFLYYEEVDLCYRLRREGFKTVFVPSVVIEHQVGGATDETSHTRLFHRYISLYRYFAKHNRLPSRCALYILGALSLFYRYLASFFRPHLPARKQYRQVCLDLLRKLWFSNF